MVDIVTRAGKGSPLTNNEVDANFTNLAEVSGVTGEPMGHEDRTTSTISFNASTRTFTIAPVSSSFTVWCKGKKVVVSSAQTVTIPNTTGMHSIYYDANGTLSSKIGYFTFSTEAPTAYVYWNATTGAAPYFGDERHGVVLDWQTHEYLHRTRGAAIANGFLASGYTLNNSATDAATQIAIESGTFFDEDMKIDIVSTATPTAGTYQQNLLFPAKIPVLHLQGTSWVMDAPTDFPFKQGTSRPQYNLLSGGVWSTADVGNNQHATTWILATNNLTYPVIAIIGQSATDNLGEAEAFAFADLSLTGFPSVEFRPLYKLIYKASDGYANSVNAQLVSIVDLRSISAVGSVANPATDHGNLSGLSDDDHPQYLSVDTVRGTLTAAVKASFLPSQTGNAGKFLTTDATSASWTALTSGNITTALGFTPYNATNPAGYITGITSSDVTTALGFTPYNATNPSGYVTAAGARGAISVTGAGSYDSSTGVINIVGGVTSFNTRTGAISLTSADVTTALGFTPYNNTNPNNYLTGITSMQVTTALGYTPYNSSNPSGYITGITSGMVTTALGFTPYNNSNPSGYITSSALSGYLTSASAASTYLPLSGGTITGSTWSNTTGGDFVISNSNTVGASATLRPSASTSFSAGWSLYAGASGAAIGDGSIGLWNHTAQVARFYVTQAGVGYLAGNTILHAGNYSSYALPLSGGTMSGSITFGNDTANGLVNAAGTAGLRLDDAWGNLYIYNTQSGAGFYGDFGSYNFRNASSTTLATLNGSAFNSSVAIQQSGNQVLHAGNYTSYSPTLTGGSASGTWNINIYGSSASATSAGYLSGGDSAFYAYLYNSNSGDLNTYNAPGLYSSEYVGGTNNPAGAVGNNGHWIQISDAGGTDVKTQWYYASGGSDIHTRLMWGNGTWKPWRKLIHDGNYSSYALPLSGGTVTGYTNFNVGITVNSASGAGYGINLYSGNSYQPTYGLFFAQTVNFGTHGGVTSDWATYFTMNDDSSRGWVFRRGTTNAASISGGGTITGTAIKATQGVYHGSLGYYKTRDNNGGSQFVLEYSTSPTLSDANIVFSVNTSGEAYKGNYVNPYLHSGNYSSYALPLSGGTVSGNLYATAEIRLNAANTARIGWRPAGSGTLNAGFPFALNGATGAINIEVSDNDTGGLMIDNEGVTVYGAGDTGYVFRVIDEDQYQGNGNNITNATQFWVTQDSGASGFRNQLTIAGSTALHAGNVGNYAHTISTDPNASGPGALAIGSNGSYSYVQSHNSQTLRLNPIGNAVQIGSSVALHASNYSSYALPLSGGTVSGRIYATGNINSYYYDVYAGDGNGVRFWSSDSYKISMAYSSTHMYGTVTDYSIKMQMDNGSPGRGFTWGRESYAPVASLNATSGNFQTAGKVFVQGEQIASGAFTIRAGGAVGVSWSTGLNIGDSSNYTCFIQDGGTSRWRNFGTGGFDWFNSGGSQLLTLSNNGGLTVFDWYYINGGNGVYWSSYGRGIRAADNEYSYGNIGTYGAGLNGWRGYAIYPNNCILMAGGSSVGIYNPSGGIWLQLSDMSGNITFAGNVTAYSDLRLKHNVREIDDVVARRNTLAKSAIKYERDGRTRIGYGAQTLRDNGCLEFVMEADDAMKLATGLGTLSVDYGETAAVLAVASKMTDDRVAALEAKIAKLEAIIETLIGD